MVDLRSNERLHRNQRGGGGAFAIRQNSSSIFFESDMLFRLGIMRACVIDIPMRAAYKNERSNFSYQTYFYVFSVWKFTEFFLRVYFITIFYAIFLSLLCNWYSDYFFIFDGGMYGIETWIKSGASGIVATTGQVMLAALPIILGVQFLLSFLAYDMTASHNSPVQSLLRDDR